MLGFGYYVEDTKASTIKERDHKDATDLVAYNITFCDANGRRKDRPQGGLYISETDHAKTLTAGGDQSTYICDSFVRRLTPVECERLQGFPDNYTLVPNQGRMAADVLRYKALGNSMHTGTIRWLGERIKLTEEKMACR